MMERQGPNSVNTANLALINRGFFIFLAVSMGLLTLALISFLWVSLQIVEDAVLSRAKYQDLPFMADSLTKPLDLSIGRLVGIATLIAGNIPQSKQDENGALLLSPDEEQSLQSIIKNSVQLYKFDAAYILLYRSGKVWRYAADGSAEITQVPAEYRHDHPWVRYNNSRRNPYSLTLTPLPNHDEQFLWANVPLGPADNPLGMIGLGIDRHSLATSMNFTNRPSSPTPYVPHLSLWLVDRDGRIILSDKPNELDQSIYDRLPLKVGRELSAYLKYPARSTTFLSHTFDNEDNNLQEFVYRSVNNGQWEMILTIPHSQTTGFLDKLRHDVTIACIVITVLIVLGLVLLFRRVINPGQQMHYLNQELAAAVQRKTKALEEMAHVDGLTGLKNRRYFDAMLNLDYLRATTERQPLSVLFIDIDFFKKYNDTYGHIPGDACLKQVADELSRCVHRTRDLVVRYGGEEFVVLLPETPLDGALTIAERIRTAVQDAGIPHQDSSVADVVTVSIGVASILPSATTTPQMLMTWADAALYKAKQSGRNRVCAGGPN